MTTASRKSSLLIIFLVVFIDLVGFGIVIPILPYYATEYGASPLDLGWLMAIYSGLQFLFAPLWGRLSDHIGRRPVLLLSMLGTGISMLLLGFSRSLAMLFAGRALAGICGANISTAAAYITDITTPENRAKGMGMIGAAFGLGFIFGPAIGGILSRYGYSVPMFAAAAISGINLIFAFLRLKEPDSTQELRAKNRAKRFDRKAFEETMGDTRTRLATVAFFITTLAITQMEMCFALFMLTRFGYSAQGAGWLLAFMGVTMVAVQGGMIGRLSKKFGEIRLILAGTFLMTAALIGFSLSIHVAQIMIALFFLALGNGVTNPSLSSLASKGARPERRGATMGVYQSAGSLARVIGPLIAGSVYSSFGVTKPFLLSAAFLAMCGVLVLKKRRELPIEPNNEALFPWITQATQIFRKQGFKGLVEKYGWKLVAAFVAYYLVRDITLYILLPWMAAKGLFAGE